MGEVPVGHGWDGTKVSEAPGFGLLAFLELCRRPERPTVSFESQSS